MSDYLQETFLYEFKLGSNTWRFTSNAVDCVDNSSHVWIACAISDDGVKQSGEAVTDALSITSPQRIAPAQMFMVTPSAREMAVNIYRADLVPLTSDQLDAQLPQRQVIGLRAVYAGEVAQANFPMPGRCVFACETISASMRREGLRLGWQRQCPYSLYDPVTCKVSKASHAVTVTITEINGFNVTVSGLGSPPAGLYNAGLFEYTHPVKGLEPLTIESQVGGVLTMFSPPDDLFVGMSVTVYRGCAKTPEACQSLSNYPNYGGVPNLPGKSPFNGINAPVF
jgi:hypothetical protein